MESTKHWWLSHLNKFKTLFTGPSVCLVETLASKERKKNRWQKVLDDIWERILVHHTCIDTESILKIGYYMTCIAHLNHIAHMLHQFIFWSRRKLKQMCMYVLDAYRYIYWNLLVNCDDVESRNVHLEVVYATFFRNVYTVFYNYWCL